MGFDRSGIEDGRARRRRLLALGLGLGGWPPAGARGGRAADRQFRRARHPRSASRLGRLGEPVIGDMLLGLTTEAADGSVIPGAAESWEVSDDGTVYTFALRDHTWSDGTPVTAEDFVFALQRILDPAEAAEYASLLYTIKNAKPLNEGAMAGMDQLGAQALDPEDARDHAREPDALLRRAADPLHRLPDPQAQGRGAGRATGSSPATSSATAPTRRSSGCPTATSSWSRTRRSTTPRTSRSTA